MEDNGNAIQSYRDLKVWQQAMDLAEACYLKTRQFPKEELYGLTSQIRRAAASVPANIAEVTVVRTAESISSFCALRRAR